MTSKSFDSKELMRELRPNTRLSLSLDNEALNQLENIAQQHGISKSEVMRAALRTLGDTERSIKSDQLSPQRDLSSRIAGIGERHRFPRNERSHPFGEPKSDIALTTWISDSAEALVVPAKQRLITLDEQNQLANLSLLTSALVIPERQVTQGAQIKASTVMWHAIVDVLRRDWTEAYRMPPQKFEELIAGAFERDGYSNVVLTPRSGDNGRDVIATTSGPGCVKVIASIKRYAAHHEVRYDDVRALLGVMLGEPDASKGMIITTSHFPKDLPEKEQFKPFIPTRLELMDGKGTLDWLSRLIR
ncbi:restriction endonuclease [Novosphingobium naphthalenivorans]|uniref:restriction endonuclease n=1 Tax=Novosphingobium naphthalenivorans TaxID=273168 RepID=UPI000834CC48|nr:restriction endonuclease [Novosphingobium naphthalenivorans]